MGHKRFTVRIWKPVVVLGLVGLGIFSAVGAQQSPITLTVCPTKIENCQHTSLQDAINAAPAGAIIQLAPEAYEAKDPNNENNASFAISKSVTLRGMGQKPEEVILSANRKVPVVRIEKAQNVTIENLTVRDGNGGESGAYLRDRSLGQHASPSHHRATGKDNVGRQANGAPAACGAAPTKILAGFWK